MPWALLVAACLGMFAATSSGTTRAPFLLDMARDLEVSLPMVANLFVVTATAWGFASVAAGAASDRWGRRSFLVGGPIALALALAGVAAAGEFHWVAAWAALAGACAGVFTSVVMAEVSVRAADSLRGRALGWVMSGQSLTLVVGVPLAAWLGAHVGWRGVNLCVGAASAAAALGLLAVTGAASRRGMSTRGPGVSLRTALSRPVMRLLAMGISERICYGLAAVYFATFLQSTYGLDLAAVAVPLVVFAMGNVVGTMLGGQLADRWRNRLGTFAGAMAASALAALVLYGWRPDLATSVALGFVYVFLNSLGRPSLLAALAEVPPQVRGTVMGLNGACASIGWIGAATLGGWTVALLGFPAFGPLAASLALLGALLALARPRR